MADKKISALTAASLPLAGTEVLPIVQSSATVKVATDDLTVKNIRSNATTGILQIAGPGAGATRTMTTPNANFTAARTDAAQTFTGIQSFAGSTQNVRVYGGSAAHQWDIYGNGNNLRVSDNTGGGFFQFDTDVNMNGGNLIQGTAAKGVNFTANTPAAGMTSQLLNWYEEGTWTPALAGSGTAGTYELATASGWYTRVGRSITVIFNVKLAAAVTGGGTGFATLTGLPFVTATTNAAAGAVTLGGVNYTAGTNYVTVMPRSVGSAQLIFEEVNINGAVNDMAISAFGVNDTIQGTLTYIV